MAVVYDKTSKRRRNVASLERYARSYPDTWCVTLYPYRADVRPADKPRLVLPPKGGRRGAIKRFSSSSRRRLMQFMASVSTKKPLFITLTYPFAVDAATLKLHLHRFSKSFRRRFPGAWYVWRIERTRRGRWHIHIITSGVVFWDWVDLSRVWYKSIGAKDLRWIKTMTDISQVRNKRAIMAYAGKYLAKNNRYDDALNVETGEIENTGRFWGVVGRENVEYLSLDVYLPYSRYMAFRRIVRRLYRFTLPTLTRRNLWYSGADALLRWLRYATGNDHLDLFVTSL